MTSSDNLDPDRIEPPSGDHVPFLTRCIATGFFSGYIPWASGTFGSLVGALFFLIPSFSNVFILFTAIVVALIAGVYTSAKVAEVEGSRLSKSSRRMKDMFQPERHATPDPSIVVIDEIVGMWIAMFALDPSFVSVAIAFFTFRTFDIIKPYPAKQVEKYGSGWGIMLDDVVAGIYANIVSRIILGILLHFFPTIF